MTRVTLLSPFRLEPIHRRLKIKKTTHGCPGFRAAAIHYLPEFAKDVVAIVASGQSHSRS